MTLKSLLFVPGDSEKKMAKAASTGAVPQSGRLHPPPGGAMFAAAWAGNRSAIGKPASAPIRS
mgnify:CR=1 FL=1